MSRSPRFLTSPPQFLFVCIASSLIILRALRPLQQVAFSHHCVLSDEELTLRIRVLRPATTVLIHPEVRVDVCLVRKRAKETGERANERAGGAGERAND